MKRLYKCAFGFALAGLLSIAIVSAANAQRGFHSSGAVHIGAGFGHGIGFHSSIGIGYHSGYGVSYYGYPGLGYRIGFLPYGFFPFYYGADLYYYYGGVFYRPYDGGGYEVTIPPVGAVVPALPKGASSIAIDGQQYYEFNGVYYQANVDDKGKTTYVIVGKDGVLNTNGEESDNNNPPAPQVGDILNQLPDGCRNVNLNGKKYYVSPEGIYYEDFTDQHNFKGYRIVSIPADDEKQN
jgi:hypothetical protein